MVLLRKSIPQKTNSKTATELNVKTIMPTPSTYKRIQPKLAKYYWLFNGASIALMVVALVVLVFAPKESETIPVEFLGFIFCALASCVFMVLGMIAAYQQEPFIRRIPIVGKLHKALIPKRTEWGEAIHIDFMAVITTFFFGVFLIVITRY